MTDQDEFLKLAEALRDAAPEPDAAAKTAALARAMEKFDRLQGSAGVLRPNPDRPQRAGFWIGIAKMFDSLTSRGALAATASVAALGLAMVVVLPQMNRPVPMGVPPVQPTVTTLPTTETTRTNLPPAAGAETVPVPAPETTRPTTETAATTLAPQPGNAIPGQPAEPVATAAGEPVPAAPPPPPAADATGAAPVQQFADNGAMAMPLDNEVGRAEARERKAKSGLVAGLAEGAVADGADLYLAPPAAAPMTAAAEAPMLERDQTVAPEPNTEAFANEAQNPVKLTAEQPVSTFSTDVDTASYAVIRSSLMSGFLPPAEAVRIEEMVNYFPYDYAAPEAGEAPFKASVTVMPAPWADGKQLVEIGLQGRLPALADRPPLNLVFLIDTSGSMEDQNKLPLLKQSLRLMLPQLRPEDQVAMVVYAGSAGEVLPPTAASDQATILAALDRLAAGGSTAGAEGLELAYQVAERMKAEGEVSRILLATDGDFNVGLSDPEGLEAYIAKKRETGTYLSVLGFGRGNLDDATTQALAQAGNGTAAYIDTLQEARKVLVDQLTGALFPIADDVKIQVEWNPATVAEWRLIGYETRALAREDFNNDKVDAGEIGAGHRVTAIYEITAPDSDARTVDPLRYGEAAAAGPEGELGFLRLRYKDPGQDVSQLLEVPIVPGMGTAGPDQKFAAAIAGFGQLLTDAKYLGDWGWDDAVALALEGRGEDPFGYRAEAISLMRLAQSLSAN
jgi:Ca-activated chloride channel family protein